MLPDTNNLLPLSAVSSITNANLLDSAPSATEPLGTDSTKSGAPLLEPCAVLSSRVEAGLLVPMPILASSPDLEM